MENKLEELLKHALTPMEEPDSRLNRSILERYAAGGQAVGQEARKGTASASGQETLKRIAPASGQETLKRIAPASGQETLKRIAPASGQKTQKQIAPVQENKKEQLTGNVCKSKQTGAEMNKEQIIGNVCRSRQTGAEMERKKKATALTGSNELRTKRIPAAALTAALIVGAGSFTVFAAYQYLTPDKVAEEAGDAALAEAFANDRGILINESQTYGGYQVTMLGITSGDKLSEKFRLNDNSVRSDRTYVVVAIAHEDGSPMTEDSQEEFFVSPLIGGYHPAFYNAASMYGNYTEMLLDGVLYRLVECDNVEIFADRDLYLGVSEGSVFYNKDAYDYDQETGSISRNQEFPGLNALFRLPIDAAKADPKKADEYILSLGITVPDVPEEKMHVELGDDFSVKAEEGNEKGAEVAEYALQFTGNPYVWGGESLTEGCDCSGFTKAVLEHFQIILPHNTAEQKKYGEEVQGLENARPGDLIFYENPSHVGIYIGEGKIVHADPAYAICVSEADYDEIKMIRRYFR